MIIGALKHLKKPQTMHFIGKKVSNAEMGNPAAGFSLTTINFKDSLK